MKVSILLYVTAILTRARFDRWLVSLLVNLLRQLDVHNC